MCVCGDSIRGYMHRPIASLAERGGGGFQSHLEADIQMSDLQD